MDDSVICINSRGYGSCHRAVLLPKKVKTLTHTVPHLNWIRHPLVASVMGEKLQGAWQPSCARDSTGQWAAGRKDTQPRGVVTEK